MKNETRETDETLEAVHDALATHAENYEIRRELHSVPPHAVYEVTIEETRAICKVGREPEADPATEARVMEFVGRETSVPVPRILGVGRDWFVAEWRDGLPGDDPELDPERARIMGAGLATLHEETAGAFERTGFPHAEDGTLEVETHDSWAETVSAQLADLRDYLAEFGNSDVATAARSFVRERPDLFAGVGAQADTGAGERANVGERADARPSDPVLAHGNYLPDHVGVEGGDRDAVTDGEVTCAIDWEHALVAPAEYDYWRTAMPLFASPGDTAAEETAFREGYESVRPFPVAFDDRSLALRLVIMVSHLQSLHLQRQHDPHGTARFEKFAREYVFDAIEELGGEVER